MELRWFPNSWVQVKHGDRVIYIDPAYIASHFRGYPGTLTFSLAGRALSLQWGTAGSAVSYVLEAGSASGAADFLTADIGPSLSIAGQASPGTFYVRVRGRGACGQLGPASNEVIVVVP